MTYGNNTYKGRYKIKNPEKYNGNADNVVYRSAWELRFMNYCDNHPDILKWSSEEIVIRYFSPVDQKIHRYFMDFWIRAKTESGGIKDYLIEVKPKKYTQPPQQRKRKTKKYVEEIAQYKINEAKWNAAQEYAENKGMEFKILTEDHLT